MSHVPSITESKALTDRDQVPLDGPLLDQAVKLLGFNALQLPDVQSSGIWLSYEAHIGKCRAGALLPDFITICPAKTGTTWLAHHLSCHPAIYIPPEKELNYFNSGWRFQSLDQYERHFAEAGSRLKGDITPGYALLPTVAIRVLQRLNPRLKLIFLARRLPERAWSQTRHSFHNSAMTFGHRTGPISQLSTAAIAADFVADYTLLAADYPGILRRWMQFFPADQFHVRYFEGAMANPEEYLRGVLHFLGVDQGFPNGDLHSRINEGIPVPLPASASLFLENLCAPRQLDAEAFLQEAFQLQPAWLPLEPDACEATWLEDRADWLVRLQSGYFDSIKSDTGEILSSRFLGDLRIRIDGRNGTLPWAGAFSAEDQLLVSIPDYGQRAGSAEENADSTPRLVQANYRDYNIVRFNGSFWGLPQCLGPLDLERENVTLREGVIIAGSVEAVRAKVDDRGPANLG